MAMMSDGRVVTKPVKLRVPQKYHQDISNIQHHRKVVISAMTQAFDVKISRNIGGIRNHLVMVDAGWVGFKCTEGNTARTMVHLSRVQYRTARLTRQI